jgi:hypothetical protein
MNTLKTGLFTLGLLIGSTSFAQTEVKQNPQAMTEKLATDLLLSAEQKEKVANLNNGIARKNESILNSPGLTSEQKKSSIQSNNSAKKDQMKLILTEEQYAKYLSIEAKESHSEQIVKEKKTEEK